MSGKLYARRDAGTWEEILEIIKTALNWQADEIVLVGVSGMEEHIQGLRLHWEKYRIPARLIAAEGESITDEMIEEPYTWRPRVFDIVPQEIGKTGLVLLNSGTGTRSQPVERLEL